MMLVFVALITAQGIGKMLEPEHNVFGAVAQFLIPILMKRNEHVPDTAEAKAARDGVRGLAAAAVVVLGCGGGKPAEPLPVVPEKAHPGMPAHLSAGLGKPARFPRPELAIAEPKPDLTEEPRWPLTIMQHPALEPQFNVAGALADPGISWTELCARGVQHRHDPARQDELAYLGGWCAAEQHDVQLAMRDLAPLMRSPVPGIANGAPFDMVNVLVQSDDADHATQLLADQQLRDAHLWDLLAAAFFEIGKYNDALSATSTAMQLDPHPAPAATCHRLAREVLLGPESVRQLLREQLAALVHDRKHVDPTCEYLAAAIPVRSRRRLLQVLREPAPARRRRLPRAAVRAVEHSARLVGLDRLRVERDIYSSRPGRSELTIAALDAAVVSSECKDLALAAVVTAVDAMHAPGTQHLTDAEGILGPHAGRRSREVRGIPRAVALRIRSSERHSAPHRRFHRTDLDR